MTATRPDAGPPHCVSVLCSVPATRAFAFLSDGDKLGQWALGCWDARAVGAGVFRGRSLFDDAVTWVRPVGDATRLEVDFHVGASADRLVPRIRALVVPGPAIGRDDHCCDVSLLAWRDAGMDDARWLRLVRCHEVEVLLIQARLALEVRDRHPFTQPDGDPHAS